MKKKTVAVCLSLALGMAMLAGCSSSSDSSDTTEETTEEVAEEEAAEEETAEEETAEEEAAEEETAEEEAVEEEAAEEEAAEEETAEVSSEPDPDAEITDLYYSSEVTDWEGTWTLSQVVVEGETYDAVEGSILFEVTLSLDPSELVDEAAYIHNQVYNVTGELTFGVDSITETLEADDVDCFKGSTAWSDFPQGEVVDDGQFYLQPGPATMRFKDIDDYGLYLDEVAGVTADVDTTEKTLIIGLNNSGQLLLGYSEDKLQNPGTEGEWVYCLIFDLAE